MNANNRRMKNLCLVFCMLISFGLTKAQTCSSVIKYKKVTWADFKPMNNMKEEFDAMTYWSVDYAYPAPKFIKNEAKLKIKVAYRCENDSWVKPSMADDELLSHEQGHVDIAYLFACELKQKYNNAKFTRARYKKEIDEIYDALLKKYDDMQLRYDKETNHMQNTQQQQQWNGFFADEIAKQQD